MHQIGPSRSSRKISPTAYGRSGNRRYVFNVDASFPPIFLLHGDKDRAVNPEESVYFKSIVDKAGVRNCQLVIVEGEDHLFDVSDPAKHAAVLNGVVEWVAKIISSS